MQDFWWRPKVHCATTQVAPSSPPKWPHFSPPPTWTWACRESGIVEQTFYRWRKEYGGLQMEQARKLKDLQKENAQLRRAVADLTVEKQILKDIAQGNL